MKKSLLLFAIVLVVIGTCSDADQCSRCAKSITGIDGSTSMDEGFCWIKVGNIGLGDCSRQCMEMFGGCSHANGYTHYTYGNMCWCKWQK
ncbi:hypothetical protein Bhyg_02446, partial [Pseudolycoriella hygida]